MKNLFKKQNGNVDLSSLSPIATSGVAVGVAIANYVGKNPKIGGIIGVGFSLLVTGLLESTKDENTIYQSKK